LPAVDSGSRWAMRVMSAGTDHPLRVPRSDGLRMEASFTEQGIPGFGQAGEFTSQVVVVAQGLA
jgi:hypothetical protein